MTPHSRLVSSGLAYVHFTGGTDRDWLAPHAMFVVFSNRCTHVGCPAQATSVGFSCPCHGSQFDDRGARTAGPAVRPLDRFQWEIRTDNQLWITQRWSVLLDGDRARYLPGQSTRPAAHRADPRGRRPLPGRHLQPRALPKPQ